MDQYNERWQPRVFPDPNTSGIEIINPVPTITPEEIAEFRRLLERAREYDRLTNQPDCENETKVNAIIELARALGVEEEVRDALNAV